MDASLSSVAAATLAWLPLQGIRLLRRSQLKGRTVIEIPLGQDRTQGGPSIASGLEMLEILEQMAGDDGVRAVVVDLRHVRPGWATLQELRRGLARIRKAGKLVVTHLDTVTTRDLYLASVADRVWLTPSGELYLQGLGAHLNFYGEALQHLGVRVEMEAAGAYKSFGEPFTRSYPTPQNREQTRELLGDLQEQLLTGIATARRLEVSTLLELMKESPLSAERAVEAGLVDAVAYPDQANALLDELLGGEAKHVPFGWYAFWARLEKWLSRAGKGGDRIAVVHLEGPIVHGAEASGGAGHRIDADRVVPVIDEIRKDKRTKAVILYVNSPGGSALASDLIAREVRRTVEEKPVIALFGDVSASGGYYLSAPAVEVIAREGTITGSIGVVGGKLVFGPALERVGVHHETIAVGPDTGFLSPWTPFTPDQRRRFRETLVRTYDRFLNIVSAGRRRPVEAIKPVAEGRVWTGKQAMEHGLVDRMGGLELALARARVYAGLPEWHDNVRHVHFPPPRFQVLQSLLGRAQVGLQQKDLVDLGLSALGPAGKLARMVKEHPLEPLALLPYEIDLE